LPTSGSRSSAGATGRPRHAAGRPVSHKRAPPPVPHASIVGKSTQTTVEKDAGKASPKPQLSASSIHNQNPTSTSKACGAPRAAWRSAPESRRPGSAPASLGQEARAGTICGSRRYCRRQRRRQRPARNAHRGLYETTTLCETALRRAAADPRQTAACAGDRTAPCHARGAMASPAGARGPASGCICIPRVPSQKLARV
jgi:hypothetical protein